MKDLIFNLIFVLILVGAILFFVESRQNQYVKNENSDTLIIRDTIKFQKIVDRIVFKVDTIYQKEIDSVYVNSNNKDSLFLFVASPFDTTLIDTFGSLKLKYIPIRRLLEYDLRLNPIEVLHYRTTDSVFIKERDWYMIGGAALGGIIVGLLLK